MHPREYAKAIIAFLGALSAWGQAAASGGYSQEELWGLGLVVVAGLAVYAYPNKEHTP